MSILAMILSWCLIGLLCGFVFVILDYTSKFCYRGEANIDVYMQNEFSFTSFMLLVVFWPITFVMIVTHIIIKINPIRLLLRLVNKVTSPKK